MPSSRSDRQPVIRTRVAAALAALVLAATGLSVDAAAPARVSGATTVTMAAIGWAIWSIPDDQEGHNGSVNGLSSSWRAPLDTDWTGISILPPTGNTLTAGTSFAAGSSSPDATRGGLTVRGSSCAGDHVDVLSAAYDGGGDVTELAIDFLSCGQPGVVRLASSTPVTALRTGLQNFDQRWSFGVQATSSTTTKTITYKNVGTTPVGVGPAAIVDDGFGSSTPADFTVGTSTCSGSLAVGASCTLQAIYRPLWSGIRHARLLLGASPDAFGAGVNLQAQATFAPVTNDRIADAKDVGTLPFTHVEDAIGATADRLDPLCRGAYQRTLWFHFHASSSQPITVDTSGSLSQDTVLSVYTGTPLALAQLGCNDDASSSDLTSRIRFPAIAGTDYWFEVARAQGATLNAVRLNVSVGAPDSTVDVGAFTQSATTFYPYPDTYADSASFQAMADEVVDVDVEIAPSSSPTTIVRHAGLPRLDAAFGYTWDGRNDASAMVPAGIYQVREHYTDLFGNTADHVYSVTVSAKRLYFKTVAKSLTGVATYDEGWSKGGSIRPSGNYLVMKAAKGWAEAIYRAKLVTAVRYKSVQFEVTGKSSNSRKVQAAIWNFALGDYDTWKWIGPSKKAWKTAVATADEHIAGKTMYGVVYLPRQHTGSVTFTVYKVRLLYTYGYLK